jgi:hypothetical protein
MDIEPVYRLEFDFFIIPMPSYTGCAGAAGRQRILKPKFTTKPPLSKKFAGWKLVVI